MDFKNKAEAHRASELLEHGVSLDLETSTSSQFDRYQRFRAQRRIDTAKAEIARIRALLPTLPE